jgi:hypothetical protein
MEVAELFVKLGFLVKGYEKLDNLDKKLADLKNKGEGAARSTSTFKSKVVEALGALGRYRTGIYLAAGALLKLASDTIRSTLELDRMSSQLSLDVASLQRWQLAAQRAGADVVGVLKHIKSMQDDFANGLASNVDLWQFLGIDVVGARPEDVLEQLVSKLRSTKVDARSALLSRLGLDSENVNLANLNIGVGRIDSMFRSDEDVEHVRSLNVAFTDMKTSLVLLRDRFVLAAYPIRFFFELVSRLIVGIDNIIRKTVGWNTVAKTTATVFLVIMAALSPLKALFVALALVVDDILTYFEGGESVLSGFIDLLKKALDYLVLAAKKVGTVIGTAFKDLWDELVLVAKKVGTVFEEVFKGLRDKLEALTEGFRTLFGWVVKAVETMAKGVAAVKDKFSFGKKDKSVEETATKKDIGGIVKDDFNNFTLARSLLLPSSTLATGGSQSINNNLSNNINIYSNQPPQQIAERVGFVTQEQLNRLGAGL